MTPGNGTPGSFAPHAHSHYDGPDLGQEPSVPAEAVAAYFAAVSSRPRFDEGEHYAANHVVAEHLLLTSPETAHLDDDSLHRQAAVLGELAFQAGQPVAQTAAQELDLVQSDVSVSQATVLAERLAGLCQKSWKRSFQSRDPLESQVWSQRCRAYAFAAVDTAGGFTIAEDREAKASRVASRLGEGIPPAEVVAEL
ncbi:hypothetical protein F8O07_06470 [Pseudoclavibacter sp. CFCC 13796]|uniref:hypothetical protein n=1 Tax=unclassified Pseudoclavibacter TaxID=2615177 RepID=UPI001300DFEC|nr:MULTISPECIES: hypothetical protein [unclassified Pseudoclavibacter]KAB1661545.1 hypothetical protein F8O07_06470 [Pseudoclavibacter sp. CFCC 13796]MCD7100575.1 hypothetical protein [Pseudoclavibacter sp. 13-3]